MVKIHLVPRHTRRAKHVPYQQGAHVSYLAAAADSVEQHTDLLRSKGVGVIGAADDGVTLLAMVLGRGHPLGGYPFSEWLLFFAMAAGPGILGHTLVNWSLAHVESSLVSVTLLGEPVGSALLALLLLAEVPGLWTVVGGAVILVGIFLTARGRPVPD